MKGQTLKEALEYIPAQPKKKFATLSSEERVKRLRQELADMEKLMRTGVCSKVLHMNKYSTFGTKFEKSL